MNNEGRIVLGVDVGGSTTKIVGYRGTELVGVLQVRAEDQVTSLYGAIGNFLYSNSISLESLERIVLTGVGASFVEGDVYGIPTERVAELTAIGLGGLRAAGLSEALVVSMGTGTAFVHAAVREGSREIVHLGGSGVGGGTIIGLASGLLQERDYEAIVAKAEQGSLSKVDLSIQDISREKIVTLPPELTASNFGKISPFAGEEDFAAGLINMVLETIGMLGVFASRHETVKKIVLTGSLTELPQAERVFRVLSDLHGVEFLIPENAVFATAIGAAMTAAELI